MTSFMKCKTLWVVGKIDSCQKTVCPYLGIRYTALDFVTALQEKQSQVRSGKNKKSKQNKMK